MNVTKGRAAGRGGWLRREAKRTTVAPGMGSVQPRARCWIRATDQSRSGFDRTSECSDTSNLARSTIRHVILVNESLSRPRGFHGRIYLQSSFSQAVFDTPSLSRFRRRIFILANVKRSGSKRIPSEVKRMKDGRITPTFREVMAQWSDKGGRREAKRGRGRMG